MHKALAQALGSAADPVKGTARALLSCDGTLANDFWLELPEVAALVTGASASLLQLCMEPVERTTLGEFADILASCVKPTVPESVVMELNGGFYQKNWLRKWRRRQASRFGLRIGTV